MLASTAIPAHADRLDDAIVGTLMGLVLIPGFMLDADLWCDVQDVLAAFGPIVHADPRTATSIEDMAARTLDEAPERFALLGFSMGGYVARDIQRLAPDRVTHLVLIATSARADDAVQAQRKAEIAQFDPTFFRGLSRSAIRKSLAPDRETDKALVDRIQAMSLRLGGQTFRQQSMFVRNGDVDRLQTITCSTLVIAGRQDRLRSMEESRELSTGISGAILTEIDAGHMIPMEAPEALMTKVGNFLRS